MSIGVELRVTPAGQPAVGEGLVATKHDDAIREAFSKSPAAGLLWLAGAGLTAELSAGLVFARDLARQYLGELCRQSEGDRPIASPRAEELAFLAMRCPPVLGAEYVSATALALWWAALDEHARQLASAGGLKAFLAALNPAWHAIGRVTLHLAENKRDAAHPFAFLATYTQGVSAAGRPVHVPLSRALQELSGKKDRGALLNLLKPVSDATASSPLIADLLESGDLYQPLVWTARQAYAFLRAVPAMEAAGLVVRVPDWWSGRRARSRPQVSVTIGDVKKSAAMGLDAMLDFDVDLSLGDQHLSPDEIRELMDSTQPLVQLRGQWVEVDKEKLQQALAHWKKVEHLAKNGLDFATGMRLLSGVPSAGATAEAAEQEQVETEWVGIRAGDWLEQTLAQLRDPQSATVPPGLLATLRPYQQVGYAWLRFMMELKLGACLADDMGLGKTVQVIALLQHLHKCSKTPSTARLPASLLIVPASLLPNWRSELTRFAPGLRAIILHPSELDPADADAQSRCDACDLVITTYGMATRLDWLRKRRWRMCVLDEAQAIKNAGTRQSKAVREIQSDGRIALSGTPIENRLGDLWSLFDFLNPGLLGGAKTFDKLCKKLARPDAPEGFAPLRRLVKPYILRRLKTDKTIISDLPDKTELKAYCTLSPRQAAMYQQSVEELQRALDQASEGIQRRGIVLAFLMRFKQICNHPAQVVGGQTAFEPGESGKFSRLAELCGELAERQQRTLVFTQFREMTQPLADHLGRVFGRPGLVLHGSTTVPQRKKLVEAFQQEDGPPFFVLSIKAGGTGLNLTAASNVIHFDRWWNPAVENQATDRAFRIGQKRNVLVHKFVCRGTIEEKIDALIESKSAVAGELLADGGTEKLLTEMSNSELLKFVALDVRAASTPE